MSGEKVLLVEDDAGLRVHIERKLKRRGLEVTPAPTGTAAVVAATAGEFDLLVLDYSLPDMDGRTMMERLRQAGCATPFLVISGKADLGAAIDLFKSGALDFVQKDEHFSDVLPQVVSHQLAQIALGRKLAAAEAALRESEARFRAMADTAPVMIWMSDTGDQRTYFNRCWLDFRGRSLEEEEGAGWMHGVHPDDIEAWGTAHLAALKERREVQMEFRLQRADGEYRWLLSRAVPRTSDSGKFLGFIGSCVDITDRKREEDERSRFEAQRRQAQKLETIGTLAGGIAHDFNNFLGSILGYSHLVLESLPADSLNREHLGRVVNAADRATELVRQILTFSRKGDRERHPVPLGPTIEEALALLKVSLPPSIDLRIHQGQETPTVTADATQIQQVLMNLATNAKEAIGEQAGRIEVAVGCCEVDENLARLCDGLAPGNYARITVSDDGCGMSTATLDRIFEPFFTTRKNRGGTGLGLSVVHGIVRDHQGAISAYSEEGVGTTFHLYLPLAEARAEAAPAVAMRRDLLGGREHILMVDDDPSMALLGRRMLEPLGYTVSLKANGAEAMEAIRYDPSRFDLVVTDQTMPRMSGLDLAQYLSREGPAVPVILTTGFCPAVSAHNYLGYGISGFLTKPFTLAELAGTVREVLDAASPRGGAAAG